MVTDMIKEFCAVIFHVHSGKQWWQEARDQILHIVYSSAIFLIAFYSMPSWGAGLASFTLGFLRELEQHHWNPREVGKQDLFYWGLASVVLTIVYAFIK
jgi:hypothetical protein